MDLFAVIELKHYDYHANSIGIQKDLDHLEALRKGIYYPYSKFPTNKEVSSLLKSLGQAIEISRRRKGGGYGWSLKP
jgi:hypothetical protein